MDPCVFIHYSDSNIRQKSLLEAMQSPMFMAYHDGQPFNDNMLRPCPMLENPEKLRAMVEASGAHSTDMQSPETADHLCAKCDAYAACWKPAADALQRTAPQRQQGKDNRTSKTSCRKSRCGAAFAAPLRRFLSLYGSFMISH